MPLQAIRVSAACVSTSILLVTQVMCVSSTLGEELRDRLREFALLICSHALRGSLQCVCDRWLRTQFLELSEDN